MYSNQENETAVNDAQATILADWAQTSASGGTINGTNSMTAANGVGQGLSFFGNSPVRWFLFIGMVLVWLYLWGRIVKYLGGHD